MADACQSCRFWDRYVGGPTSLSNDLGDCRFNPPAISQAILAACLPGGRCDPLDGELVLTLYPASAFPVTHEDTWCGRFERPHAEISPC